MGGNMTYFFATIIIVISFVIFFYLFANIFLLLLFDIPATFKFKRKELVDYKPVLKKYTLIVLICSVIVISVLSFTYFLFIKYSFGFSISIFVGACFALLQVIWKIISLFFRFSNNYIKWLDFYRKDNSQYLTEFDLNILNEALGYSPEELDKI
ncbi:MAG: hypothetical protein JW764_05295 [Chlorobiaceae bacterium]|nr:hypothetical protein [Chlorobiaceae bacterium]